MIVDTFNYVKKRIRHHKMMFDQNRRMFPIYVQRMGLWRTLTDKKERQRIADRLRNKRNRKKRKERAGNVTKKMRDEIYKRDRGKCQRCQSAVRFEGKNMVADNVASIDHVTPISLGGQSTPDNLQLLCTLCHEKKSRRDNFLQRKKSGYPAFKEAFEKQASTPNPRTSLGSSVSPKSVPPQ